MTKVRVTMTKMEGRLYSSFDPEDPWTREHYHKLTLDLATFNDMGQPETITVTIEEGNQLNDEEE